MAFFLYALSIAALLCLLIFLKNPSFTPLRNSSKSVNAILYAGLCLFFFLLAGHGSSPEKKSSPATSKDVLSMESGERPVGGVLQWEEISRREVPMRNGRNRLVLLIMPLEDQSGATQSDLLDTAKGAAIKYQKESGAPVVIVSLAPGRSENSAAEPLLAHVVYIPDGKGFDGDEENLPRWETLRAAARGFTGAEVEYLRVWTEMSREYQSRSGLRLTELDAAVSRKLGLAPGTLDPFANRLQDVEISD